MHVTTETFDVPWFGNKNPSNNKTHSLCFLSLKMNTLRGIQF